VLVSGAFRADESALTTPARDRRAAQVFAAVECRETGLQETLLKLDAIARQSHPLNLLTLQQIKVASDRLRMVRNHVKSRGTGQAIIPAFPK
jgi:hypothetical protein